ncbi:MAG TPA: hypothetical protein VGL86_21855, partial [Polyangia bacterium]
MLDQGLVVKDETAEAKRAALRDAQPVESEKQLPPPFEAPPRGVIVSSGSQSPMTVRLCADCGATLPSMHRRELRCAECAADGV